MCEKLFNRIELLFDEIKDRKSLSPILKEICYLVWRILCLYSLRSAVKEQKLVPIMLQLEGIVPDYNDQYSYSQIEGEFQNYKIRAHHAFQVSLVNKVIDRFDVEKNKGLTIVDIGDSSGTHIKYFKELYLSYNIRCISVNLDPVAIEKIRNKGFEAIHAKAEELEKHDIHPDIIVSFQMLEHLNSPVTFLKSIAENSSCKYLVITVPYRKVSRVGLFHIRNHLEEDVYAESTHVFELCPEDWRLISMHAGWRVIEDKAYLQYPKMNPLRLTRNCWKNFDHEGFYGMILEKDSSWSKRYLDW
jgi:2-polyprenyl-3-methyl-5-hydroxy-6-metoxy-1,4-benzoquinol methylase